MARPFLADAHFVLKAKEGRSDEINTCIGCNQVRAGRRTRLSDMYEICILYRIDLYVSLSICVYVSVCVFVSVCVCVCACV